MRHYPPNLYIFAKHKFTDPSSNDPSGIRRLALERILLVLNLQSINLLAFFERGLLMKPSGTFMLRVQASASGYSPTNALVFILTKLSRCYEH